jgi:hypothetical protein
MSGAPRTIRVVAAVIERFGLVRSDSLNLRNRELVCGNRLIDVSVKESGAERAVNGALLNPFRKMGGRIYKPAGASLLIPRRQRNQTAPAE